MDQVDRGSPWTRGQRNVDIPQRLSQAIEKHKLINKTRLHYLISLMYQEIGFCNTKHITTYAILSSMTVYSSHKKAKKSVSFFLICTDHERSVILNKKSPISFQ